MDLDPDSNPGWLSVEILALVEVYTLWVQSRFWMKPWRTVNQSTLEDTQTQSWADRWCEWNGSRPRLTPVGWQRNVTILRSSPSCSQSLSMMRMIWSVSMSWRRSSPAYNITVYPQGDPIKGDVFIWLPSSLNAQTNLYNLWHTPGVLGSQYICQLESRFSFSTSAVG